MKIVLSLAALLFIFPQSALACQCMIPPPCVAYNRAYIVFTGKLRKIEVDKDNSFTYAHFDVERSFKGKPEKVETVRFMISDCGLTELKAGEKYFVYKDYQENSALNFNSACNRTHLFNEALKDKDSDFIYADSLSQTKPSFMINGEINWLSENQRRDAQVFIEDGKNKYPLPVDNKNEFSFTTFDKGTYTVRILLPFYAEVEVGSGSLIYADVKGVPLEKQTSVVYETQYKPNSCDYREIKFRIIDKPNPK